MRVISGQARGRRLREPEGMGVRPTTDKVKESIFNIIQFDIPGSTVLDLFAGTGQLGIEALSRGADRAVFVDASPTSLKLVRENLKAVGFTDRARALQSDAISYLKGAEKFDVIFLDPPYAETLLESAVSAIIEFDILKENGIIICESDAAKRMPDVSEPYFMRKEYRYGKIKLTLYGKHAG